MSPHPPRMRRDPRDPASMRARPPPGLIPPAPCEETVLRVEAPACHVLAVVDLEAGRLSRADRHLMGAARQLADALQSDSIVTCEPSRVSVRALPINVAPEQE